MREESSAGTGDISKDGGSAMAYGSGAAGAGPRRARHGASTAIRAPCGETAPSASRDCPPVHRPSFAKAPGGSGPRAVPPPTSAPAGDRRGRRTSRTYDFPLLR